MKSIIDTQETLVVGKEYAITTYNILGFGAYNHDFSFLWIKVKC